MLEENFDPFDYSGEYAVITCPYCKKPIRDRDKPFYEACSMCEYCFNNGPKQ